MIFDTHTHYDDKRYDEDREQVIRECLDNNVGLILNVGADFSGCTDSITLAEKFEQVYAAVGIHPHYAMQMEEEKINWLRELAKHPKVVAIGEIGLDYYYEGSDKDVQIKWFRRQLELGAKLNLPVLIHDRDAHMDVMECLKEYCQIAGEVKGVVHCYSGSAEMAKELVKMGFYIAFGGAITFKNARRAIEACEAIPIEKMLLETDCPYLSPEPLRGKRNESSRIKFVVDKIAEIKHLSANEVEEICFNNGVKLFNIQKKQ